MPKRSDLRTKTGLCLVVIISLVAMFGGAGTVAATSGPTGQVFAVSDHEVEAPGAWLSGWAYRIPLSIDRTKIFGSLDDLPVLVRLGSSSGTTGSDLSVVFGALGSHSRKIALTASDGTTQCYVEIARWDSAIGEADLWVKVPRVSGDSDTYLYLYFDGGQPDNTDFVGVTGSAPAQQVWDGNFVAVWHLTQAGNGAAGEYRDSTSNHHDGQGGGGLGYGTPSTTTFGASGGVVQEFNGVNDYISIPDADAFSVTATGSLTISAWMSPSSVDQSTSIQGYTRWLGKSALDNIEWQFTYYDQSYGPRSQWISYANYGSAGGLGVGDYSTGSLPANSWAYVTAVNAASGSGQGLQYIYRNAAVYTGNAEPWSDRALEYTQGSAPVTIGTGWLCSGNWWYGRIGEVRISSIARSTAWIAASYYAESDALVGYGFPQGADGVPPSMSRGTVSDETVTPDPGTVDVPVLPAPEPAGTPVPADSPAQGDAGAIQTTQAAGGAQTTESPSPSAAMPAATQPAGGTQTSAAPASRQSAEAGAAPSTRWALLVVVLAAAAVLLSVAGRKIAGRRSGRR